MSNANLVNVVNRWEAEEDGWEFRIDESLDGYFNVYYNSNGYWVNNHLWFPTYQSARSFMKKEYDLSTRMKKVSLVSSN